LMTSETDEARADRDKTGIQPERLSKPVGPRRDQLEEPAETGSGTGASFRRE
jgi:hypothetical protein